MDKEHIVVDSYFDGRRLHKNGPFCISIENGRIVSVKQAKSFALQGSIRCAPFVMPGMVEAHCHLFLDGGELDFAKRSAYLKSPFEQMLAVGRRSLTQSLLAGITLVRDAGDIHGVNRQLRDEVARGDIASPSVRCPGTAIRKAQRYGSFMAREVSEETSIEDLVAAVAGEADDIKVLMTGIIDFEAGEVKGSPQFDLDEACRISASARHAGRRTFAHCSGKEGIEIALQAGLDSIEHGFFVTKAQLDRMAEQGTTWVPTFSPVHFQWLRPELAGWNTQAVDKLREILDAHREQLSYAYKIGVPVLVGSDAGSFGVEHGQSYIEELFLMAGSGVPLEQLLHSATALPRKLWGCDPADIVEGNMAELVLLNASPFDDLDALRQVEAVYKGQWFEASAAYQAAVA